MSQHIHHRGPRPCSAAHCRTSTPAQMSRSHDTTHGDEYAPRMDPGARLNPAPRVMDADLKPWALYSLVGADEPESLDERKRYFIRYRATKSKVTSHAFTHDALQRSWCAFIRRWNAARRTRSSSRPILYWRASRTALPNVGRVVAFVLRDLREGCHNCSHVRRPTQAEWDAEVLR